MALLQSAPCFALGGTIPITRYESPELEWTRNLGAHVSCGNKTVRVSVLGRLTTLITPEFEQSPARVTIRFEKRDVL